LSKIFQINVVVPSTNTTAMSTAVNDNEKGVHGPSSPPHGSYDAASPTSSISLDKDVAIGLVGEHAREIDPAIEAKVLRKIDWFLLPGLIVGTS
jgi:hypothetical protein